MVETRSGVERASVSTPAIVIGLGNEHRGDDASGLLVARLLRPRLAGVGSVAEGGGDSTELLDLWEGWGLAVVVDAVRGGGAPGSVHRLVVGRDPLPPFLPVLTSNHGISLGHAIALAQTLHRMPKCLVIYGIEGVTFDPGAPLSPAVAEALRPVASAIEDEVRKHSSSYDPTHVPGERNA
ncbi:MAG: hydrogenase maturation protease [Thermoplasmata archaeon]